MRQIVDATTPLIQNHVTHKCYTFKTRYYLTFSCVVAQAIQFLTEKNKCLERRQKCKTLLLLDATLFMDRVLENTKETIKTVFSNVYEILMKNNYNDLFEIMVGVYRNYADGKVDLFQHSAWESKPDNLKTAIGHKPSQQRAQIRNKTYQIRLHDVIQMLFKLVQLLQYSKIQLLTRFILYILKYSANNDLITNVHDVRDFSNAFSFSNALQRLSQFSNAYWLALISRNIVKNVNE
ncbi:Conserved_hypothetical protein [Hexamita inflata]|uniref:Uncharacterized protein n=1 Tax=Hexamita inflata TaxID=28002 RepID=A0AA86N8Z5_9EUKA|nr:Conserved hypothetical protein [Hexamita inflata]